MMRSPIDTASRRPAVRRARLPVRPARATRAVIVLMGVIVAGLAGVSARPVIAAADGARAPEARARARLQRSRVRADTFWSQSLGTRKRFLVYLPGSYDSEPARRYPVAYYLHGLWGSEQDWLRAGKIDVTLDSLIARGMPEIIVILPDGDDGWYTTWNYLGNFRECTLQKRDEPATSYCVPWLKYDDYIARDLVARVDSTYRTLARREHRGIAGLSMGGFGAVTLALNYPDVFAAAASHSGALSPLYVGPKPFNGRPRFAATEDELREAWGRTWPMVAPVFGRDTAGWWARDPSRLAERFRERHTQLLPALMLDVGREDFLLEQNRAFRSTLRRLGIAHRYAEWSGAHTWRYWSSHVDESLRWLTSIIAPRQSRSAGADGRAARLSAPGAAP